jgi:hypothetical protein
MGRFGHGRRHSANFGNKQCIALSCHDVLYPAMDGPAMLFSIYGRYRIEVVGDPQGGWRMFKQIGERRVELRDFVLPAFLEPDAIAGFLDDMLHESSRPGESVVRLA